MLNTGYIPLNSITKGSQSSGRKTPAKPFPGHLWDCASWFNTSIWCVVFVLLDYKFLCSVAQVSWKRPVWDFWNQKVWLSTSLLKIISCNFIFTILEASIHFIGCLNGALRNANTQAWMNVNKYAAHTWEVIFSFSHSCYSFYSVIPLKDSRIGALKNAALKPIQADDNVYIIDDYH